MRRIVLFVEDSAHRNVIGTLIARLAQDQGLAVELVWYTTRGGYGRVKQGFQDYVADLKQQQEIVPDLAVVASDANCKGINERIKGLTVADPPVEVVFVIPDPHIERWLLLDGKAFKEVLGEGCAAPDQKCDRDRYKQLLYEAIAKVSAPQLLGGEPAEKIARHIDIARVARADKSFKRFVDQLDAVFTRWQQS